MGCDPVDGPTSERVVKRAVEGTNGLVGDEVAVFAKNIGSNFDDVLVARRVPKELKDSSSGVLETEIVPSAKEESERDGERTSCSSSVLVTI